MHSSWVRTLGAVTTGLLAIGLVTATPAAAATITPPVTIVTQPADATVVQGTVAEFTAAATDSAAGDVPVTAWEQLVPGGAWTPVPASAGLGTLSLPTTVGSTPDGTQVRATFDDGASGVILTNVATLIIQTVPVITVQPDSGSVAKGSAFQLTAGAAGSPTPTVQWQTAALSGGPWIDVPTATSATLQATAGLVLGSVTWYRAVFTNAAGSAATVPVSITVNDLVPAQVTGLVLSNPSPGVLTATWDASTVAGTPSSYDVMLLDPNNIPLSSLSVSGTTLTASFSGLSESWYGLSVVAKNSVGSSPATLATQFAVSNLHVTATVSASVLRPFRDGFQDAIIARATRNFAAGGSLRILNSASRVVRTYPLASGTAWTVTLNGRTAANALLPIGAYRAQFILGGVVVAIRPFTIASSQVGTPRAGFTARTVFPVKDGYVDTTHLNVTTSLPATVAVVIKNSRGTRVAAWSLTRRMSASIVWTGRTSRGALPAGTYKATVTVKGGEGVARVVIVSVVVSAKYLHAVKFSGQITAYNAFDFTIQGSCDPVGNSIGMWSAPGDDSVCAFSAVLPASFGNRYANLRLSSCSNYTGSGTQPAGLIPLDSNGTTFPGWQLTQGAGCDTGTFPVAALNGRTMIWAAGNVAEEIAYYWIDYFQVTGTRYVLS